MEKKRVTACIPKTAASILIDAAVRFPELLYTTAPDFRGVTSCGIDPGNEGAVVRLYSTVRGFIRITAVRPVAVTVKTGRKKRTSVDASALASAWDSFDEKYGTHPPAITVIEDVQAAPFNGLANFKLGHNKGAWEGFLTGRGVPYKLVAPKDWQAPFFVNVHSEGKQRSIEAIRRLFPTLDCEALDDGACDAIFLALYPFVQKWWEGVMKDA